MQNDLHAVRITPPLSDPTLRSDLRDVIKTVSHLRVIFCVEEDRTRGFISGVVFGMIGRVEKSPPGVCVCVCLPR